MYSIHSSSSTYSTLTTRAPSQRQTPSLQALPQPIRQLGLAHLCQVVDTLFAKGVDATEVHVLRRRLAHPLHNDGRVCLKDDAVVDDLVHRQRHEIVALDDGALVDRGLEKEVQGVAEGEDGVVQEDFVLVEAADEIDHDVAF